MQPPNEVPAGSTGPDAAPDPGLVGALDATPEPEALAPGRSGSFRNDPIDVAGLPQLPDDGWELLDRRYLQSRWLGDGIAAGLVVIAALVATVALPDDSIPRFVPALVGVVLLALIGLTAWLQWLEINRLGYLVRDHDFSFRSGVISRTVTTVPFARIQHVSIDRGPVARAFGLATLNMRTAGSGALVVPGVDHETAQRLKTLVADRAGALADDELTVSS